MRIFALLFLCLFFTACDKGPQTAVVDVNQVLLSSPHAKKGEAEAAKSQEIYQYNLDAIQKKLETYKNKPQAEAWLLEAARLLQNQHDANRTAITQAMGDTLHKEITALMGTKYDLIFAKSSLLANQAALDITAEVQQRYNASVVTWPPQPKRIDNPDLPADTATVQPEAVQPEAEQPEAKQRP